MMAWIAFPYPEKEYTYTPATLKHNWTRLHMSDAEPFPEDAAVQTAWIAFHAGEFEHAKTLGLAAGGAGLVAANKAQCIYANYIEDDEASALALFDEVAKRCEAQQQREPNNPAAYFWHAYALGRFGQSDSVSATNAQRLAMKVKASLATAIKLAPHHADAHTAQGTFIAEMIEKFGTLIASLTYGVKRDTAIAAFKKGLELNPDSAIGRIEYANGLVMLDGQKGLKKAEMLYAEAAECDAFDAMERMDVELAISELSEDEESDEGEDV
jgi:tetratricopeptide (TPR) repeat protein